MQNKTPQFVKALDEYFSKLELDDKGGQWCVCRFSGNKFYVRPEDIEFYKKIRVPLPTVSPVERTRQLLAFDNPYYLFRHTSAFTQKPLIANFTPGSPYKIYEHTIWYSDQWDPMEYGRTFDSSRDFFVQYHELQKDVPRPNLVTDSSNINSDYTNESTNLKNCYLTFWVAGGENLAYIDGTKDVKDSLDGLGLLNSTNCYMCLDAINLFNCKFCEYARNCMDSAFLYDCRDCSHCFMSSNLRHKKYYFFNQQLGKEEYEEKMRSINLGNFDELEKYKGQFKKLKEKAVWRNTMNEHAVASDGEWIRDSKNCFYCYFVQYMEDCAYTIGAADYRNSYDVMGGWGGELCYEFATGVTEKNFGVRFSYMLHESRDCEYSELLQNCRNCFGCVGLTNKSFCILNRQYSEEEYWKALDVIKTNMLRDDAYGEFFPKEVSPYPYNATIAVAFPGYDNMEEAKKLGFRIEEIQDISGEGLGEEIRAEDLPKNIEEVGDDILAKIILDTQNNMRFRIIKMELEFYRRHNLPLPRVAPMARLAHWRKQFNIRIQVYERPCARCGKMMQTSYAPDRPEKNIWCERCYLSEIG